MSEVILQGQQLSLIYQEGTEKTYAVDHVDIKIHKGEFVGVMGPSGSGKSSLLYLLSGLKRPTEGSVIYQQTDMHKLPEPKLMGLRLRDFGFVFQQPYLMTYLSALENVLLAAPGGGAQSVVQAHEVMQQLGLQHLENRRPYKLSGGEKQRVCVARAMAHQPDILFADEPTASLDRTNGEAVMKLIAGYRSRGAVMVVSHDPAMLKDCDTMYHMHDGHLVL